MVCYSRDVDILRYEPALFGELHLPSQVIMQASGGKLEGSKFTVGEADFVDGSVEAGGVIYLKSADGAIDGTYEIVSIESQRELTVSVVRAEGQEDIIEAGQGQEVSYRVVTYRPQAQEAGIRLAEYLGIKPCVEGDIEEGKVLESLEIRRLSVFLVLANLYAMLGGEGGNEDYWKKSEHYTRLFEKAKERLKVGIDLDSDGVSDKIVHGGASRLVRD
jgi:hypothetical protein